MKTTPPPIAAPRFPLGDDYAGTIGKQRDADTGIPTAGIIYDCNPHGHTVRPYRPPNTWGPYVFERWKVTDEEHTILIDTKAYILLTNVPDTSNWQGSATRGDQTLSAQLSLNEQFDPMRLVVTLGGPSHAPYVSTAYQTDLLADWTRPSDNYPEHATVQTHGSMDHSHVPSGGQTNQNNLFAQCAADWSAMTPAERAAWQIPRQLTPTGYERFMKACLNHQTGR